MSTDRLVYAVTVLTVSVVICITALAIFRPGDSTGTITTIVGAVLPVIAVMVGILQNQQTAKEVQQETKQIAVVVEQARQQTALKVEEATKRVDTVRETTATKVDEIRDLVNGRHDTLVRENIELKDKLKNYEQEKSAREERDRRS